MRSATFAALQREGIQKLCRGAMQISMLMVLLYIGRVETRQEKGRVVAAVSFTGIPLDWEVLAAERKLRGLLLVDGLPTEDTYHACSLQRAVCAAAIQEERSSDRAQGIGSQ